MIYLLLPVHDTQNIPVHVPGGLPAINFDVSYRIPDSKPRLRSPRKFEESWGVLNIHKGNLAPS